MSATLRGFPDLTFANVNFAVLKVANIQCRGAHHTGNRLGEPLGQGPESQMSRSDALRSRLHSGTVKKPGRAELTFSNGKACRHARSSCTLFFRNAKFNAAFRTVRTRFTVARRARWACSVAGRGLNFCGSPGFVRSRAGCLASALRQSLDVFSG